VANSVRSSLLFEPLLIPLSKDSALSVPKENEVTHGIEEKNKAPVLEAFDPLFNQRDYAAPQCL
jgi:hypothetical protein